MTSQPFRTSGDADSRQRAGVPERRAPPVTAARLPAERKDMRTLPAPSVILPVSRSARRSHDDHTITLADSAKCSSIFRRPLAPISAICAASSPPMQGGLHDRLRLRADLTALLLVAAKCSRASRSLAAFRFAVSLREHFVLGSQKLAQYSAQIIAPPLPKYSSRHLHAREVLPVTLLKHVGDPRQVLLFDGMTTFSGSPPSGTSRICTASR